MPFLIIKFFICQIVYLICQIPKNCPVDWKPASRQTRAQVTCWQQRVDPDAAPTLKKKKQRPVSIAGEADLRGQGGQPMPGNLKKVPSLSSIPDGVIGNNFIQQNPFFSPF